MRSPAQDGSQNDSIAELRAQLAAQRSKRHEAVERLKSASAEAAEGTPADSSIFHLFAGASGNGTGCAASEEAPVVEDAAEETAAAPCKADLVALRQKRKNTLAALKKTSMGIVTYRETRILKKGKL